MGVLDDAIRQHLELKRQHGVPEEELQRQEEEALGPARRDVAPAESADGEAAAEPELHDEQTILQEPEGAEPAPPAPAEEAPGGPAPFDGATELLPPEREAAGEGDLPGLERAEGGVAEGGVPGAEERPSDPAAAAEDFAAEEPVAEGQAADDPSFAAPEDAVTDEPSGDTLPSGFEAVDEDELLDEDELEDEDADEGEEEDADVLEDTPDFLQETPEHDRLWFEQKPPRDFDFD
jgi:hypothetical protein